MGQGRSLRRADRDAAGGGAASEPARRRDRTRAEQARWRIDRAGPGAARDAGRAVAGRKRQRARHRAAPRGDHARSRKSPCLRARGLGSRPAHRLLFWFRSDGRPRAERRLCAQGAGAACGRDRARHRRQRAVAARRQQRRAGHREGTLDRWRLGLGLGSQRLDRRLQGQGRLGDRAVHDRAGIGAERYARRQQPVWHRGGAFQRRPLP